MVENKKIINLLPNKGNIINQFLSWALTIGRLLVIITETLALGVFLYRFSIDMLLVDLHDKIENASVIVASLKPNEDIYRDLHARLSFAKQYDKNNDKSLIILKDIIELGKGRVTFRSLNVTLHTIGIEVQASSIDTLSYFTGKLRDHPEITKVSLDRVENKTSNAQIIMGISADIKQ